MLNKNILVTGGLGFIGSNLVDSLIKKGYKNIWVIDNLSSDTSNIEYKNKEVNYIIENVNEIQTFKERLPEKIDFIFHLAANTKLQPSFDIPLDTFKNNVLNTAIICDFAKQHNAKLIYPGSSSFYAGVYKNPYAFSKWNGEELCKMYNHIYNLDILVVRFFNVYGPRQPYKGEFATVLGIFERQYKNGEDLTVIGNGLQTRDFVHVYDICNALIKLVENNQFSNEIYNIGSGQSYTIKEIAEFIIKNGYKDINIKYLEPRKGEAKESLADISKINKDINWFPGENLKTYLQTHLRKIVCL